MDADVIVLSILRIYEEYEPFDFLSLDCTRVQSSL